MLHGFVYTILTLTERKLESRIQRDGNLERCRPMMWARLKGIEMMLLYHTPSGGDKSWFTYGVP
jgi:hypothetical protein